MGELYPLSLSRVHATFGIGLSNVSVLAVSIGSAVGGCALPETKNGGWKSRYEPKYKVNNVIFGHHSSTQMINCCQLKLNIKI